MIKAMRIICFAVIIFLLCASTNVSGMDPPKNIHTHEKFIPNYKMVNDPNCPYNPHNLIQRNNLDQDKFSSHSEFDAKKAIHEAKLLTKQLQLERIYDTSRPNTPASSSGSGQDTPRFESRSVGENMGEISSGKNTGYPQPQVISFGKNQNVEPFEENKMDTKKDTSAATKLKQDSSVTKKEEETDDPAMDIMFAGCGITLATKLTDLNYRFCEAYYPVQYWAMKENPAWIYSMNQRKDWKSIQAALEADKDYTDFVNGTTASTKYLITVDHYPLGLNYNPLGLSVNQIIWNSYVDQNPFVPAELLRYHPEIYRVNWAAVDEAVQRYHHHH